MAVKHLHMGEVHKGQKGGITWCGFDTRVNPTHWIDSGATINCDKNGCKN